MLFECFPWANLALLFFTLLSVVCAQTFQTFPVIYHPYFIATDSNLNVWVSTNNGNSYHAVIKLSNNGSVLGTFPVSYLCAEIKVDQDDNVWVTVDGYFLGGPYQIWKLSNNGNVLGMFNTSWNPNYIAADNNDNIWVGADIGSALDKFDSSGNRIGTYSTGFRVFGLAVDKFNNIWAANFHGGTVVKFNNSGNILGYFPAGEGPKFIAFDNSNNAWITDYYGNTVTVLDNSGSLIGTYNTGNDPYCIAFDKMDNAWITNSGDNTVVALNNDGNIIGIYEVGRTPWGIASDSNGNVWVANSGDNTVTKIIPLTTSPTSSPTTISSFPSKSSTTVNTGTFSSESIIGSIVGVLIVLVLLFVYYLRRRKSRIRDDQNPNEYYDSIVVQVASASQTIPPNSNSLKQLSASIDRDVQIQSKSKNIQIPKLLKIKPQMFILKEKIGSGGFSQVFKVECIPSRDKEHEMYAFKQFTSLRLGAPETEKIKEEIEMLALLEHPNIIQLIGVSDDPESVDGYGKPFGVGIVMEYCENGSWRKILDKDPFPRMDLVIRVLFNVAKGMMCLHQHQPNAIIHRDLKSDNILLDKNMNGKICDFGLSKIIETVSSSMGRVKTGGTTGTLQYKAPEAFDGDLGFYSDVYAFGCVIFESLNGKRPWNGFGDAQIMKMIFIEKKSFDVSNIRQDAHPQIVELMKRCLDKNKKQRPSFAGIISELDELIPQVILTQLDIS